MKSHTSNNYPQIKLGIIQNVSCNTVKSTGTTFIRGRTIARAPWIRRGRVLPRTTGMQRDDGGGKEKAFSTVDGDGNDRHSPSSTQPGGQNVRPRVRRMKSKIKCSLKYLRGTNYAMPM